MPNKSTGTGQHSYEVRGDDLYETPEVATRALLNYIDVRPGDIVWEPACGPGAIVRELQAHKKQVCYSDINDYGLKDQVVRNFLDYKFGDEPACDWVITNPPFMKGQAHKFRNHALNTLKIPNVALLVRLAYLEGVGRMLDHQDGTMAKVIIFSRRLPMMHRHGWEGPTNSSSMAFCWVVWNVNHYGPPDLEFVDWKEFE
jgi:hypothetical protein